MFRLFQLKKIKKFLILLAAVLAVPLAGASFAAEWNLDGSPADRGNIRKIVEVFKQGDVEHIFDKNGRKILRTFPDSRSGKKVEYRMSYDIRGRLSQVECFIDGKKVSVEKGVYDDDGLLRSVVWYNADMKELFSTTMLVYDEKTRLLKMYGVQTPEGIVDYHYRRNKAGQIVYVRCVVKNKLVSAAKYSYNANGMLSEVRRFNERMQNSGILRNSWKTDKNGNWTEKKSFMYATLAKRAVFGEIVTRKIEYAK
jgi:hypothetical protein